MKQFFSCSIEQDAFLSAVHTALSGARCTTAWAGVGNALYVGFELPGGTYTETPRTPSRRRELSTAFCRWTIAQGQHLLCTDEDSRAAVLEVLSQLISQTINRLEVERDAWLMQVSFSNDLILKLSPYTIVEVGVEEAETDAWVVQEREKYYSVSCAGELTEGEYKTT